MSEHFISNIEIKNFKCFKDFKAEGFGRVNLIGGKNNVGKTAFMEACFFLGFCYKKEIDLQTIVVSLMYIESLRYDNTNNISHIKSTDILSLLKKFTNMNIRAENSSNIFSFEIKDKSFQSLVKVNDGDYEPLFFNEGSLFELYNFEHFISSYAIGKNLIVSLYDKIKEKRKREKLNKILNQFDKNILEFDIINNKPQVFLNDIKDFKNISELGHGLKRYITIISSILINKDGLLFLDEIENGIHYSNLDKLWKIILTLSKEQNVQVFATTHSEECIESYARVAKELEDEEIKFIELFKHEEKIKTIVLDNAMLELQLKQNHEVR